jgi:hypothetical protein
LQAYRLVNINSYVPNDNLANTLGHAYGDKVSQEEKIQIEEENQQLITLVSDNKNLELSKLITTLYD